MIGVQVALSVTLLAGAGLLIRSIDALSRVDVGFDSSRVLRLCPTSAAGTGGKRPMILRADHGTLSIGFDSVSAPVQSALLLHAGVAQW